MYFFFLFFPNSMSTSISPRALDQEEADSFRILEEEPQVFNNRSHIIVVVFSSSFVMKKKQQRNNLTF